jgi:hypothetical protein
MSWAPKDTTAISQHQGETILPTSVAVIAPNPTVLASIRPISGHNGTSEATKIAATPASATLKWAIAISINLRSPFYASKRSLDEGPRERIDNITCRLDSPPKVICVKPLWRR